MHLDQHQKVLADRKQAYGAHLDFTSEGRQVKGELELGVCELAAAAVGGIWTDNGGRPLKQIDTPLQPQHLWRALDRDIKVTALFSVKKRSTATSAYVSILVIKDVKVAH